MSSLQDYSVDVHKSLQQPDLLLGIPKAIVALIFCLTVLLVYLFGFGFSIVGIILYVPCKIITKNDPQLLTIALESLFDIEYLEG